MDDNLRDIIQTAKEKLAVESIELIVRDLEIEDWDEDKLQGCCPFHNEKTSSFKWNSKNSSFHCFGCNKSYDIINHYISFQGLTSRNAIESLLNETGFEYSAPQKKQEKDINRIYKYPKRVANENDSMVKDYWKSRGISDETLKFFDVTSNQYGNTLFNYYDEYDVLTFIKARYSKETAKNEKIIGITPKEDKKNNISGAGDKPVLYGMNKVNPMGTLNISEGEGDSLSLHEAGITNAVSVPFGSNTFSWIEYNYEWLSQFSRIVVWMDNDEAGVKARREIISRLGHHKCRFIDIPKEIILEDGNKVNVKDVNDVLVKIGKEKILELSKYEKELPIEGIMSLEDAEDFNPETWDGLRTGIKQIDDNILYKFFFGTVATITGTPGSGKSTIVNQWFINEAINQGYGVTIFSGEMSPSILKTWIEVGMAGREHVNFKPNSKFIRIIDKTAKEKIIDWYRGKIHVLKDDDNNLEVILKRAEQTVMVNGDKILILDNLATIGLGENDVNTFSKQAEMMNKLKAFAIKYNILIVLVVHPRKPSNGNSAEGVGGYEMGGSASIFNLCHYNVSVRRYTDADKKGEKSGRGDEYKRGKEPTPYDTCIQFYKNRLMGTLGKVDMYFDMSYRFYTNPEELWKRYNWDKDNKTTIPNHDPNNHGIDEDIFEDED